MQYKDETFANQDVLLDGNSYINCKFRECKIIFGARGPVGLVDCNFNRCRWGFDGPAADTITFMAAMYAVPGMKDVLEATFDNIRGKGPKPQP